MTKLNWRSPRRWLVTSCSAGTALWLAGACSAAVVTSWTAPRGGLFSDPANWSAGVPGSSDTAVFDLVSSYPVDLDDSTAASRMLVRSGQVTLNLGGNTLDLLNGVAFTPGLVVGNLAGDDGALLLAKGTIAASFASIGFEPASSGSLEVGAGAVLDVANQLAIGQRGVGAIAIDGGAVGAWGMQLGSLASSVGTATIIGGASSLDIDTDLIVGFEGSGTLLVQDGAVVTADQVVIAQQTYSVGSIVVEGDGSMLVLGGSLDIGFDAMGSLTIADGGRVETGTFVTMGTLPEPWFEENPPPAGNGTVSVLGPGSLWIVGGDLHCPYLGYATLTLGDGGRVFVGGDVEFLAPSYATVTIVLSAADVNGDALVGAAGSVALDPETPQVFAIELADGFVPIAGDQFTILAGSEITGATPEPTLPSLPVGLAWSSVVSFESGSASWVLRIVVAADYNGDGVVDGADLGTLLALWGGAEGDLNGDGIVNGADLGILLAFWSAP
ncbi:MAG: hypothetical protein KDA22_02025 [Phycisphaerales bacterium]|nr:hypothetical protein [Phycisphaerales bacterium]